MKRAVIGLAMMMTLGMTSPASAHAFDIGFTVRTGKPTNVISWYRVSCVDVNGYVKTDVQPVEAVTPYRRVVPQTLPGAVSCRIHVAAWDIRPWVHPHHGVVPHVETWVIP